MKSKPSKLETVLSVAVAGGTGATAGIAADSMGASSTLSGIIMGVSVIAAMSLWDALTR